MKEEQLSLMDWMNLQGSMSFGQMVHHITYLSPTSLANELEEHIANGSLRRVTSRTGHFMYSLPALPQEPVVQPPKKTLDEKLGFDLKEKFKEIAAHVGDFTTTTLWKAQKRFGVSFSRDKINKIIDQMYAEDMIEVAAVKTYMQKPYNIYRLKKGG